METTDKDRALARGAVWVVLGRIVSAVSAMLSSVLAARVLGPDELGVMGIVVLVIATLNAFSNTGFNRALVQRKDVEGYVDVAWTVQLLRGFALGAIVSAIGWPLAQFYDEPRLTLIFVVIGAALATGGMKSIAQALYHRDLNFRVLVLAELVSSVLKLAFVITLLFTLRSVWALVWGQLVGAVLDLIISYWIHPHRPRFTWDTPKARELMNYGKWLTGMAILGLLVTRGDDMFISKYLGLEALGLYAFAYNLANTPATNVTHVVGRVTFPAYARLNDDDDRAAIKRTLGNVTRATLLITAPLSILLWLGIDGIVAFVVGPKWAPITELVPILVLAGFIRSVAALATGLFHGAGFPRLDFMMNLPRFLILGVLIWPACAYAGLTGAAWLAVLAITATMPTWFYGLKKIADFGVRDLLTQTKLPAVASAILVGSFLLSEKLVPPSEGWRFALQALLAVGLWLASLWLLGRLTALDVFGEVKALSRALKKKKA